MLMLKSDFKRSRRGLVPLAERGSTVWTSPLTQDQAEEDSQRKAENGTHDPQTGEIILQHADPAGRTSPHHHHRGLDDGVGAGVGWLGGYGDRRCWITGHGSWETLVWRRSWRLEAGGGCSGRGERAIVVRGRDCVVRWRSVLESRFTIHIRSEASGPLHQTNMKSSRAALTWMITGLTQTKTKTKIR